MDKCGRLVQHVSVQNHANISIGGGTFTLANTVSNGKGFSADKNINVTGGTIGITNGGASGRGFNADVGVNFGGGDTTVNLSGPTVLNASGSGFNPAPSTATATSRSPAARRSSADRPASPKKASTTTARS